MGGDLSENPKNADGLDEAVRCATRMSTRFSEQRRLPTAGQSNARSPFTTSHRRFEENVERQRGSSRFQGRLDFHRIRGKKVLNLWTSCTDGCLFEIIKYQYYSSRFVFFSYRKFIGKTGCPRLQLGSQRIMIYFEPRGGPPAYSEKEISRG